VRWLHRKEEYVFSFVEVGTNNVNFFVSREQGKKPRFESNDVKEGRTVFLRNLPFSVDNDKLQDFAEQFGPVEYAVVCIDPKSDHSRGTGFIKFQVSLLARELQ